MASVVAAELARPIAQVAQALREEVFADMAPPEEGNGQARQFQALASHPALELALLEVGHVMVCCGLGQACPQDASRERLTQASGHPWAAQVIAAVRQHACLSNFFPALVDDPQALAQANARMRQWLDVDAEPSLVSPEQ